MATMMLPQTDEFIRMLAYLREVNRAREDMVRARVRLDLQIQAIQRRRVGAFAEASVIHLREAYDVLEKQQHACEREMRALARQLPIWPWVESIRGFGEIGLAQIVAETTLDIGGEIRHLSHYGNPAKVWKRLGLAVINGERQRKKSGLADAVEHGYSPRRRSIIFNIGESLIKGNGDGLYRRVYLERKAFEIERDPTMRPIMAHNRARRYMEKLLLKHVWQQWRQTVGVESNA